MKQQDQLRLAINDVLISGIQLETKIENILKLFNQYSGGVVIGWLDTRVKAPEINTYVDVKKHDGTELYERLVTEEFLLRMRQGNWQWKPTYIDDFQLETL